MTKEIPDPIPKESDPKNEIIVRSNETLTEGNSIKICMQPGSSLESHAGKPFEACLFHTPNNNLEPDDNSEDPVSFSGDYVRCAFMGIVTRGANLQGRFKDCRFTPMENCEFKPQVIINTRYPRIRKKEEWIQGLQISSKTPKKHREIPNLNETLENLNDSNTMLNRVTLKINGQKVQFMAITDNMRRTGSNALVAPRPFIRLIPVFNQKITNSRGEGKHDQLLANVIYQIDGGMKKKIEQEILKHHDEFRKKNYPASHGSVAQELEIKTESLNLQPTQVLDPKADLHEDIQELLEVKKR